MVAESPRIPAMTSSVFQNFSIATAPNLDLPAMQVSASGRRWVLREADTAAIAAIEVVTKCDPVIARLLVARGIKVGDAKTFLTPSLRNALPDPSVLTDMDVAAERLARAIMTGETTGVFGDYDVDGTCGAAILKLYFNAVAAPLEVYLPDRLLEGYGPTIEAFRALRDNGARLIVTVDCGAAAHQAIGEAAAEGLSVIILDHHQMDGPAPAGALATVNPHRDDDASGLTLLSAAGVVFMTIVAINRLLRDRGYFASRREPDLRSLLDLTALGLVCDVMPMTGLARVLTAHGLKVLANGGNPGLKELGKNAGMKAQPTAFDLGFLLGPRINAAGRIGHARLAFELLTTADPLRRASLAEKLHMMNAERQAIERAVQDEAIAFVESKRLDARAVIVAAGQGWHPGVVGIVAGRLKDRYQRPAIVIGVENGIGKGSARSIAGVDIGAAIRLMRTKGLLIAGGGHAMAAGLTIDSARMTDFDECLEASLRHDVDRAVAGLHLRIDAILAPGAVNARFARLLEEIGPFGTDNPEPMFVLEGMTADRTKTVGEEHIACDLISATGDKVRAIAFRAAGEPLGTLLTSGRRVHVAGRIKPDDWRGGEAAQFQIADAAGAT
ncbi:MAG: single-stranded-DNA-specific exonuclease RecJ [Parvularculaceae bacterium]|nr:single-stranded-DNA-specific exonuclease RecJ [Parvularculaceae bacterium]